ncbi:MAG: hypothetical protein H6732_13705 [Alphaproteobacteria bacterium]|nr:hypothetical protein [Alphaproteobacteria bacterium]
MTALFLVVMATACVALSRLHRFALAGGRARARETVSAWEEAIADGLVWLRPWLAIGPVCWLAAFSVLAAADGHAGWARVAAVLGMLPLHGVLLTGAAGGLHVARALHGEERHEVGWVLSGVAAVAAGLSIGSTLRWLVELTLV